MISKYNLFRIPGAGGNFCVGAILGIMGHPCSKIKKKNGGKQHISFEIFANSIQSFGTQFSFLEQRNENKLLKMEQKALRLNYCVMKLKRKIFSREKLQPTQKTRYTERARKFVLEVERRKEGIVCFLPLPVVRKYLS